MTATAPLPVQPFLQEIRREADATRRVIDAIPAAKLAWRPHPRSHSIGQLALHVAGLPSGIAGMLRDDTFDFGKADFTPSQPASKGEILAALDKGLVDADAAFGRWSAAELESTWRGLHNGVEVMAAPKAAVLRNFLCNHVVHHRGQLTVYLRLLDVPVPSVYGPTADEGRSA